MAIFASNDREKVNKDIEIPDEDPNKDLDEIVDDSTDVENNPTGDKKPKETSKEGDDPDKKDTKPEETSDYWKKKFGESTRENQIERERTTKANEKIAELTKPKEITEEVMQEKYDDWDSYDEGVKSALKSQVKQEQRLNQLEASSSEYHNERKWNSQVQSFVSENTETEVYPLAGRESEFKKFVNKPSRKGMDLGILAAAFSHEVGADKPKPTTPPKGDMMNAGSGSGATNKHTTDKKVLNADDAKRLRENNPKEYERKIRSGELDITV